MKEAATNASREQDRAFVQSKIIVGAQVRAAVSKSGRAVGNVVINTDKVEINEYVCMKSVNLLCTMQHQISQLVCAEVALIDRERGTQSQCSCKLHLLMHSLEMPVKVKLGAKTFPASLLADVVPLLDVNSPHVLHQIIPQCKGLVTSHLLAAVGLIF